MLRSAAARAASEEATAFTAGAEAAGSAWLSRAPAGDGGSAAASQPPSRCCFSAGSAVGLASMHPNEAAPVDSRSPAGGATGPEQDYLCAGQFAAKGFADSGS